MAVVLGYDFLTVLKGKSNIIGAVNCSEGFGQTDATGEGYGPGGVAICPGGLFQRRGIVSVRSVVLGKSLQAGYTKTQGRSGLLAAKGQGPNFGA